MLHLTFPASQDHVTVAFDVGDQAVAVGRDFRWRLAFEQQPGDGAERAGIIVGQDLEQAAQFVGKFGGVGGRGFAAGQLVVIKAEHVVLAQRRMAPRIQVCCAQAVWARGNSRLRRVASAVRESCSLPPSSTTGTVNVWTDSSRPD